MTCKATLSSLQKSHALPSWIRIWELKAFVPTPRNMYQLVLPFSVDQMARTDLGPVIWLPVSTPMQFMVEDWTMHESKKRYNFGSRVCYFLVKLNKQSANKELSRESQAGHIDYTRPCYKLTRRTYLHKSVHFLNFSSLGRGLQVSRSLLRLQTAQKYPPSPGERDLKSSKAN